MLFEYYAFKPPFLFKNSFSSFVLLQRLATVPSNMSHTPANIKQINAYFVFTSIKDFEKSSISSLSNSIAAKAYLSALNKIVYEEEM